MAQKLRILYCLQSITTGGVEKRRLLLAKYLNKGEYDLKIICTKSRGAIVNEMQNEGMEVIEIGDFSNLTDISKYKKVLRVIKEFKPHIIHGSVFEGVTIACVTGFLGCVPVVIAEETSDPQNRSFKASMLLKTLTFVADKVIAIAPNIAEYLEKVALIPKDKIITINNGVEIPRAVDDSEIKALKLIYNIKETDMVVGSVGRLHNDHKRFTDIIAAIALLPNNEHIKLLIVGSGNDESLIKEAATNNGLEHQLIMTGFQLDVTPFYQLMDVFCLVSQREGFGLVAAEAMLNKLPVIATKVGGLQNVVVDHVNGFLVKPLDPGAIAAKLSLLLNDNSLCEKMGAEGYLRAMNEYTAEVYTKKVEGLYTKLIKQKRLNI